MKELYPPMHKLLLILTEDENGQKYNLEYYWPEERIFSVYHSDINIGNDEVKFWCYLQNPPVKY